MGEGESIRKLREELQETRQRLALISLVTNAILAREPLEKQLAELVQLTRVMLDFDACVIRTLEDDGLRLVASAGIQESSLPPIIQPDCNVGGAILQTRRPLAIEDVQAYDASFGQLQEQKPGIPAFASYIGAPMMFEDCIIGIMAVYSCKRLEGLKDSDLIEHLQIVANHAAVAIENDRLARRAQADREERIRAEFAVSHAEQIYRNVIAALGGVPYRRRIGDSLYDFVGKEVQQLTGFDAEELTQTFFASRVRQVKPLDPDTYRQSEERARIEAGTTKRWRADYLFERKDGSFAWITDASIPWVDRSGGIVGTIGILLDVTERKHTEEALRERENRLNAILNADPECVTLLSLDGTLIEINRAGLQLLEAETYSPQIRGRRFREFVVPEERDRFAAFHEAACAGEDQVGEFQINTLKGKRRRVESYAVPLRESGGEVGAVLNVSRDITERHELEMQLRQSRRMEAIGHLAGGIAHDFNNILTGILGLVDLSLDSVDVSAASDLEEIKRLGERGADLTRQLLSFSRQSVVKPVVFNLNSVIKASQKLLRTLIGEHIELITFLDPNLATIKADPGQMEQVIMNLVVNARDAMPEGGKITVQTRQVNLKEDSVRRRLAGDQDEYVLLTVRDTGHGMSEEVRERIFEPFFTTKKQGHGTGLGLATVYGIIKQSGGEIWVFSKPQQGTSFEIYLPALKEEAQAAAAPKGSKEASRGTETILVAEDEESVRNLVVRVLRARGYSVLESADGSQALALFEAATPTIDLLLTDVVMPQMGGRELVRHVRAKRPELKVIFMSGYTSENMSVGESLGPLTAFVEKPFSPAILTEKVRQLLNVRPEEALS